MEKITGTVKMLTQNENQSIVLLEVSPGKPAEKSKPATQAVRVQVATNDKNFLDGIKVGQEKTVAIS